jgi:hypothetical protein
MGRTIPSFRIAIDLEQKEWKSYQKYLNLEKRKLFREMFSIARLYNSACSYCSNTIRIYPILLSIIFNQYKSLKKKTKCNIKMNLFPYEDILTKEIDSWKSYSDCLRKKDRELFDQMLKNCYQYSESISAKGRDYSTESLLMTLLFEQYKRTSTTVSTIDGVTTI